MHDVWCSKDWILGFAHAGGIIQGRFSVYYVGRRGSKMVSTNSLASGAFLIMSWITAYHSLLIFGLLFWSQPLRRVGTVFVSV